MAAYSTVLARKIASRFDLRTAVETYPFPGRGNIHRHTYLLRDRSPNLHGEYLLQQINQQVFPRPAVVMAAMVGCIQAQERNLKRDHFARVRGWETITLIPTKQGQAYLKLEAGEVESYWRLMKKIADCRSYQSLDQIPDRERQLNVAEEAGRGLAMYRDLTADMDISRLEDPLPGYRDTALYFDQLHSVLAGNRSLAQARSLLPRDPVVRQGTEEYFLVHLPMDEYRRRLEDDELRRFIDLAKEHEQFAVTLNRAIEQGRVQRSAIHGDTKLENFLFSTQTGHVKALVDLDTVMAHTWLVDWGDMVRSVANLAGERKRELARVWLDMDVFEALAHGFLTTVGDVEISELELMVEAVQILALELGVRYLTDYLRGDTYFRLKSRDSVDLNKVRAMVQLTLFEEFGHHLTEARECVRKLA